MSTDYTDRQLGFVLGNRQRRDRTRSLDTLLSAAMATADRNDAMSLRAYRGLSAEIDAEFARVCRFDGVRGGKCVLLVYGGENLYNIRVKWHARLRRRLQLATSGRVAEVVFKPASGRSSGVVFDPSI